MAVVPSKEQVYSLTNLSITYTLTLRGDFTISLKPLSRENLGVIQSAFSQKNISSEISLGRVWVKFRDGAPCSEEIARAIQDVISQSTNSFDGNRSYSSESLSILQSRGSAIGGSYSTSFNLVRNQSESRVSQSGFFGQSDSGNSSSPMPPDGTNAKRIANTGLNAPEEYTCPLSLHIMTNPVTLKNDPTNQSFEKDWIERWVSEKHSHPITRSRVNLEDIMPNPKLQREIEQFIMDSEAKAVSDKKY